MNDGVFVDIDNTLLYSEQWDLSPCFNEFLDSGGDTVPLYARQTPEAIQAICGPLDKIVEFDCGTIMITRVRPGAAEFLLKLRMASPKVYALSAGIRSFQLLAMKAHGLLDQVDELYGRESLCQHDPLRVVPILANPLLVDDQPPMSMLAATKLGVMGAIRGDKPQDLVAAIERNYVQIDAFNGDPADKGFDKVMQEVSRKLGLL